jgi:serine/threonine protein kinase
LKICLSCDGVAATNQDRCASCEIALLPTSAVHFPIRRGEVDAGNPLLGSVIDGKFLLQNVLGRGGMGTVFRAMHTVSQVPVAIKLLHPRLSARPEFRRSLLSEARKVGRVVHDQCARVLDVGETEEGTVYLAMELADGETLDAWVRDAPMPIGIAIDVLTQIGRALVAIHAAGLVHRDLSSRNVMIALRNGVPIVKVLDFGIAQSVAIKKAAEDRAAGDVAFANPVFSAPEHLAGNEVDARADLYSFGVVAYQVLTGRLPVNQPDARTAARATIAGELQPLGTPPQVPRRLLRLVQSCLARDRNQRPQNAAALLAELTALLPRRSQWLQRISVVTFAAAAIATLLSINRTSQPFMRLMGDKLTLLDGTLLPTTPVQYLKSANVASLRGTFGGFTADRLVVEIWRSGQVLHRQQLLPQVDRAGSLVLQADTQTQWEQVVERLRNGSREGPLDLLFSIPGEAVLGDARLQIDDSVPELRSAIESGSVDGRSLLSNAVLRWQIEDHTGLSEFQLRVRLSDERVMTRSLPLATGTSEVELGLLIAQHWQGFEALGAGEVILVAVDRAGNRTSSPPAVFEAVDVAVPQVEQVTGLSGEAMIPYLGPQVLVQAKLSGTEAGLRFSVLDAQGHERLSGSQPSPDALGLCRIELRALANNGDYSFTNGTYRFIITDLAGNRSEQAIALSFRSRSVDGRVVDANAVGAVRAGDELVIAAGHEIALDFRCNATFRPLRALVQSKVGAARPEQAEVPMVQQSDGGVRFVLPPLSDGEYEFVIDLEEPLVEGAHSARWLQRLLVLPPSITLQLPDCRGRFLEQLRQAGVFTVEGDQLRDGTFRIEAALRRCIRGAVWVGPDPGQLIAMLIPEPESLVANLLPRIRVTNGRNIVAFELRDILGRPVQVECGGHPVPVLQVENHALALLADFYFDPAAPQIVGEEVRVEFEQPTRIKLRSPLPFLEIDRPELKLAVGNGEWVAAALRPLPVGSELEFILPFQAWVEAAGLDSFARESFPAGITVTFDATLRTPAGSLPLRIGLHTARTTLRPIRLGELAPVKLSATLPQAFSAIEMVPVLAPSGGLFLEPVPAEVPGRASFRSQPPLEIRNFPDVFVQRGEFTIHQYAVVLEQLAEVFDKAALLHADDPLGIARAEVRNMLPLSLHGDAALFARLVEQNPEGAVQGVSFFQAFTAVRLLSLSIGGTPDLLRLPLGCELELAALGADRGSASLYGAAVHGAGIDGEAWRSAALGFEASVAGPSALQSAAAGDKVASPFGGDFTGLDFGAREWVMDLPWGPEPRNEFALPEWSSDHSTLSARTLQFARGMPPPANLQARLRTLGVLRGLPLGATTGLLDARGAPLRELAFLRLPETVPGVVRSEQVRRDGRDLLPGSVDPRVLRAGFRIASGQGFVARVRGL